MNTAVLTTQYVFGYQCRVYSVEVECRVYSVQCTVYTVHYTHLNSPV